MGRVVLGSKEQEGKNDAKKMKRFLAAVGDGGSVRNERKQPKAVVIHNKK